jgi:hypothetical protein
MSPATAFDDRVVISIATGCASTRERSVPCSKARELLALSLGLLLTKIRETANL